MLWLGEKREATLKAMFCSSCGVSPFFFLLQLQFLILGGFKSCEIHQLL